MRKKYLTQPENLEWWKISVNKMYTWAYVSLNKEEIATPDKIK